MKRADIPEKRVFERAEILEEAVEEVMAKGQAASFSSGQVADLLTVTQYYKALLDGLLNTPADSLLATAEGYVRSRESLRGPQPCGEDELSDWLDAVAEAYRYYKSRFHEAKMGLGICPMGHEHLMRLPDESTPEYMNRVMRAFKDFGIDAATQIGKERLPRLDELAPSIELPEEIIEAIEQGAEEEVIDAEFVPPEEDPEPEKNYLGRFTCTLVMAEARFKTSLVKQNLSTKQGATGERPEGGMWMDVVAPRSALADVAKLAKLCGMKQEGDWTEVEGEDEGPSGAVSGAEGPAGTVAQDNGADGEGS